MPKDSTYKTGETGQNPIINIPEGVKKSPPEDFNIGDIGNIDLREAETIANEDILFLDESDLIEGLEDFDLIPLKDGGKVQDGESPAVAGAAGVRENGTTTSGAVPLPRAERAAERQPEQRVVDAARPADDKAPAALKPEPEDEGGKKWISLG